MGITVNGVAISDERIEEEMTRLRERYEAYVRDNGGEPSENELRTWSEEDLIESELFRQKAFATYPEPTDDRARQHIASVPEVFEKIPAEQRLEKAKEALRVKALMKALRKKVAQPEEAEIRAFYDAHPEAFVMEEALRLSHLCWLIRPGRDHKADVFLDLLRIRSELQSGQADWGETVRDCSETFLDDGGFFPPVVAGDLPPDVEAQLFALKPGEISDVIELDGRSLHLFRLHAKEPSGMLPYRTVRETISELLFGQKTQSALEGVFDTLKKAAAIERVPSA